VHSQTIIKFLDTSLACRVVSYAGNLALEQRGGGGGAVKTCLSISQVSPFVGSGALQTTSGSLVGVWSWQMLRRWSRVRQHWTSTRMFSDSWIE